MVAFGDDHCRDAERSSEEGAEDLGEFVEVEGVL